MVLKKIADFSIAPSHGAGNTISTTLLIGEKAVDILMKGIGPGRRDDNQVLIFLCPNSISLEVVFTVHGGSTGIAPCCCDVSSVAAVSAAIMPRIRPQAARMQRMYDGRLTIRDRGSVATIFGGPLTNIVSLYRHHLHSKALARLSGLRSPCLS